MNKLSIIFLVALLTLNACKSKIHLQSGEIPRDLKKVVNTVEESQLDFETVSAKARVHFKGQGINQSVSVHFKIINDSIIWGAVAATLGLEVGYFYITKNEAIAIDRFNRRYFQYSIPELEKLAGIPGLNYSQLENILVGNFVYELDDFSEIKIEKDVLAFIGKEESYFRHTLINTTLSQLSGYELRDTLEKWNAVLSYTAKLINEDKSIPKIIEARLFLPKETYVKVNYYKVDFNKSLDINTSIPNDYQKAN
ncbi:MAG: DUF4292 domain-containing protein [Bacteroidetes bacterium]|mgnify:FL=1|nr:DUF4292 domain-containing protein [Bacteroidota bacterium]MBT5528879.1 DUF4292 domain-containing protein [Cytophagia bacterium]MBT4339486.1 DUF4292 domain-containing protein [Bacteroidota bacterium]MBT4729344.1 DUF4292 domain-containing protein [Bacteroidota bacterium]MBT4968005.1 DUF4292 domain-containing protein [Bacteroidota bacterium]